jgi:hypothetical protein
MAELTVNVLIKSQLSLKPFFHVSVKQTKRKTNKPVAFVPEVNYTD